MAIPREAQAERAALIRYLRAQLIPRTCGDAEEHWNESLKQIIAGVIAGKHVKAQLIPRTCGDAEEHWNESLKQIIAGVIAGKQVKAVRNGKV